ncbi:hypothetical protein AB1K83_05495 [Sporosarcina sp. 179-K 3D1 HS]
MQSERALAQALVQRAILNHTHAIFTTTMTMIVIVRSQPFCYDEFD